MSQSPLPPNTLIFDIGDVLFSWSANTTTSISPLTLKAILNSTTWFDYERGRLSQDECYHRVGTQFSLDPSEIEQAFIQARDSLQPNEQVIACIRELKANSNGQLRVFAMSNISAPDYECLRTKPADWSIFDHVFTSAAVGERKPNLAFYRHVIAAASVDPQRAVFVDDKLDNVLSARSLGFHGIVFDEPEKVLRTLRNLVGEPIPRARQFLSTNAGVLNSVTNTGIELYENFAQLLILEATEDRRLVTLNDHERAWNFWQGNPMLTTEDFPFDLDTTSIALMVIRPPKAIVHSVMDEMLQYLDADGIIQTYFDHERPRFDPVVCVNALTLFYAHGRGAELHKTLLWVREVLYHRAYLDGTRYYVTPECFLYFLGRLLERSGDQELHAMLKPLLRERVQERIGAPGDALALAMRILTCASVGVRNAKDARALLPLQCEDGGWEIGWVYKYGSSRVKIGNRGLTTALAISALEAVALKPVLQMPAGLVSGRSTHASRSPHTARLTHGHQRGSSLSSILRFTPVQIRPGSPDVDASKPPQPTPPTPGHRRRSSLSGIFGFTPMQMRPGTPDMHTTKPPQTSRSARGHQRGSSLSGIFRFTSMQTRSGSPEAATPGKSIRLDRTFRLDVPSSSTSDLAVPVASNVNVRHSRRASVNQKLHRWFSTAIGKPANAKPIVVGA